MRRHALVLLALACSVLVSAPAFAQAELEGLSAEERSELGRVLEAAKVAFDTADYATAIVNLERAYALFPEPNMLHRIGVAYERRGDLQTAVSNFERYLRDVPDARDRDETQRRIDGLKRDIAAAEPTEALPGKVTVESSPTNASVWLGLGEEQPSERGGTPLSLELPAGTYRLIVKQPGYTPSERVIDIAPKADRNVTVHLAAEVAAAPPAADNGAWIWLAGGTGFVAGAAAVTLGVLSTQAASQVKSYDDERAEAYATLAAVPDRPADYNALQREADNFAILAFASAGVAAVGLGTVVVLWLFDDEESEGAALRVAPAADGIVVRF